MSVTPRWTGAVQPGGGWIGAVPGSSTPALAAGTVSISSITSTGATLNGAACTNGTATFTYQFQTSPDNGSNAPTGVWTNRGSAQSGLGAAVAPSSQGVTGLSVATKYWARYTVTDSAGSPATANASPVSFTTLALPTITLTSPVSYQVFQRSGTTGGIVASGQHDDASSQSITVQFNSGTQGTVATGIAPSTPFSGTLASQPQGEGDVIVGLSPDFTSSTTVSNVGIGDIFPGAGQSNMSSRIINPQTPEFATSSRPFSAPYTAGMYGNAATPNAWVQLADPTGAAVDSGATGGSYIPHIATAYVAYHNLPFGYIPCAVGGTSITQWVPQGTGHNDPATLYGQMYNRIMAQPGGVKCVLWHQGEQDEGVLTTAQYRTYFQTLAAAIVADFGCKIMPCKLQTGASFPNINAAIAAEWASNPNVLPGPDLSDMGTGLHLTTDGEAAAAGNRWWMALYKAFWAPVTPTHPVRFRLGGR